MTPPPASWRRRREPAPSAGSTENPAAAPSNLSRRRRTFGLGVTTASDKPFRVCSVRPFDKFSRGLQNQRATAPDGNRHQNSRRTHRENGSGGVKLAAPSRNPLIGGLAFGFRHFACPPPPPPRGGGGSRRRRQAARRILHPLQVNLSRRRRTFVECVTTASD